MLYDPLWVMVEGPDGAGKSTLARMITGILSENQGPTVLHKTRAGSNLTEYMADPLDWRDHHELHVVQDRGAVSAAAYEPVKPHPLHPAIIELIPEIVQMGCLLIHVTASTVELAERVTRRGDAYIQPGMLTDIVASYADALSMWEGAGGVIYEFDTSDDKYPGEADVRLALASLAAQVGATE